jgi:hypothetical protein
MVTRRRFISAFCIAGSTALVAGCSSSGTDSNPESDDGETTSDQDENTESTQDTDPESDQDESTEGLDGFDIINTDFRYNFSGGISTTIAVDNQTDKGEGPDSINIRMDAYVGDEVVDSDDTWEDTEGTFSSQNVTIDFELQLENISETAEQSIDDLTEVQILGKRSGSGYSLMESYSGESLRDRVDN